MKRLKLHTVVYTQIFTLVIFFFTFTSAMVDIAMGDDNPNTRIVSTFQHDDIVIYGYPNADEGITRNESHFPNNLEQYIPMPIPEHVEPDFTSQPENKQVSFDLITKEEIVHESPSIGIEGPVTDWTRGGLGIPDKVSDPQLSVTGDEDGRIPKNFFDLTLVSSPDRYPWRANVKLFMTFPGGSYYGSGVLIDPMHVITAGHCVHEGPGGAFATSITVVPAYENGARPYGDASSVQLHAWTGWTIGGSYNHDIGVIDLDRPIGALTGCLGYGYNNDSDFYTGNTFHNPGYPMESPYNGEYMYYWYGHFDFTDGNQVGINKYTYGGQSGGGAYFIDNEDRIVCAILSSGTSSLTFFSRITSDKYVNIRDDFIGYDDTPSTFDLIPLDVKNSQSTIAAGSQLSSLSYLVHNYSSASYSGNTSVDVYLSTNDNISTSDTLIQTHSVTTSIGPKSSTTVTVSTPPTIPVSISPGNYYIGVILDSADANTANNDSDGQDASPITVTFNSTPTSGIGLYNPEDARFFLKNSLSGGPADTRFYFAPSNSGWESITGDWNGNGQTTVGFYNPNQSKFYLKNNNSGGAADIKFVFGPAYMNWMPITGDWNGNGQCGIGLYDPTDGIFRLKNANNSGTADEKFRFGPSNAGWQPISGDWDCDGVDTIGLYSSQNGTFYLKNTFSGGSADVKIGFGPRGTNWKPVCGDWDGDGIDEIGLFNPLTSRFYLKNTLSGGTADIKFDFGPAISGWLPLSGSW